MKEKIYGYEILEQLSDGVYQAAKKGEEPVVLYEWTPPALAHDAAMVTLESFIDETDCNAFTSEGSFYLAAESRQDGERLLQELRSRGLFTPREKPQPPVEPQKPVFQQQSPASSFTSETWISSGLSAAPQDQPSGSFPPQYPAPPIDPSLTVRNQGQYGTQHPGQAAYVVPPQNVYPQQGPPPAVYIPPPPPKEKTGCARAFFLFFGIMMAIFFLIYVIVAANSK